MTETDAQGLPEEADGPNDDAEEAPEQPAETDTGADEEGTGEDIKNDEVPEEG